MIFWASLGIILAVNSLAKQHYISLVWVLLLSFILAFQFGIGGDYEGYRELYYSLEFGSGKREVEPLFLGLLRFLNALGLEYQALYLVSAIFIAPLLVAASLKFSHVFSVNAHFLLFLFYSFLYFEFLSVLRQALALALVFYAASFLLRQATFKFVALCVLAAQIHFAAILSLVLIPIFRFNPNRFAVYVLLGISFYFYYVSGIKAFSGFLAEYQLPYHNYFTSVLWKSKEPSLYAQIMTFLLMIAGFVIYEFRNRLSLDFRMVNVFLAYVVMRCFLSDMQIGHRALMYFEPFLIVFFCQFINGVTKIFKYDSAIFVRVGLVLLFLLHFQASMLVRLNDDPSFASLSLNFGFIEDNKSVLKVF